ncbi:MAG: hypothetical protein ICV80_06060 [Microcoleus sp. T1-bin1]|nr:hypothetical protein [Microcoleus sp. T1-bin1]
MPSAPVHFDRLRAKPSEGTLKAPLSVEQPSLCNARTLSTNSLGIRL